MPTEDPRTEDPHDTLPDEVTAWTAQCPNCQTPHLTMLTRAKGDGPWSEIIGGVTTVAEQDYYCTECRAFINLKDPDVWTHED